MPAGLSLLPDLPGDGRRRKDTDFMTTETLAGWLRLHDLIPDFEAETTQGPLRFWSWADGHWALIASHASNFTAVCSSELAGLARAHGDFAQRGVKLLALSADTLESHRRFVGDIEDIYDVSVDFPIADDSTLRVARLLGMLHPKASRSETVRRTLIVDPLGRLRAVFDYPREVGRSVDETLRVIDALQTSDRERVVTPSDWWPGDRLLVPTAMPDDEAETRFGASMRRVRDYLRFVERA